VEDLASDGRAGEDGTADDVIVVEEMSLDGPAARGDLAGDEMAAIEMSFDGPAADETAAVGSADRWFTPSRLVRNNPESVCHVTHGYLK
jgi:hypothetical protein